MSGKRCYASDVEATSEGCTIWFVGDVNVVYVLVLEPFVPCLVTNLKTFCAHFHLLISKPLPMAPRS